MASVRWRRRLTRIHGRRDLSLEVELSNEAPTDDRFLTGNGFAKRCRVMLNYGALEQNPAGRSNWWFCKTDRVHELFSEHPPGSDIVLVTHNSDLSVDRDMAAYVETQPIRAWFAANLDFRDPRFRTIPAGIANPHWPHGNTQTFQNVQASRASKSRLFDVSFSLATNREEREYCLEQTGLQPAAPRSFETYLRDLSKAYFCVSPRGNGMDCHRTWEALYLRTVPVVTRSLLTDHHRDLPMVVLDDWSEFHSLDFTPEFYEQVMQDWGPAALALDRYIGRLDAYVETIGAHRAG
jgi:hypothetical protein